MKTMHIGEFKAQFSEVLEWVKNGNMIRVVKGKSNELVGYFTLKSNETTIKKRKLGIAAGKGKVKFIGNINTSEKEFFGS